MSTETLVRSSGPLHELTGSTLLDEIETWSRAQETDPDLVRRADVSIAEIQRVLGRAQTSEDERDLALLVRLLAARLEGLSSEEVATVLGFNNHALRDALHGVRKVQASKAVRLELVEAIVNILDRLLERPYIGKWFRTPVPALRGKTPLEAIRTQQGARVLEVVESYLEPVY